VTLLEKVGLMEFHEQRITASAAIFAPEPVLYAYLYGSYARGDVHPFSDIDIAVYRLEMNLGLALDAHLDHKASMDVS